MNFAPSLDDLVGAREQRWRNCQAERLRGLEIDHQLEFGGRLDWKFAGLLAPKNAIDVRGRLPELLGLAEAIRKEPTAFGK